MQLIEEYIQKPKLERQKHLVLELPCLERGGNSTEFRGLLAHILETNIPSGKQKIHLCHACHNGKCSRPEHLYWGTSSENSQDRNQLFASSPWDNMVKKYGEEKARDLNRNNGSQSKAGSGNRGKTKTPEHRAKISASMMGKRNRAGK